MWEVGVFVMWEVDESICLVVHRFLELHLRGYLGEKRIFLLVLHVWLLVLSLGG